MNDSMALNSEKSLGRGIVDEFGSPGINERNLQKKPSFFSRESGRRFAIGAKSFGVGASVMGLAKVTASVAAAGLGAGVVGTALATSFATAAALNVLDYRKDLKAANGNKADVDGLFSKKRWISKDFRNRLMSTTALTSATMMTAGAVVPAMLVAAASAGITNHVRNYKEELRAANGDKSKVAGLFSRKRISDANEWKSFAASAALGAAGAGTIAGLVNIGQGFDWSGVKGLFGMGSATQSATPAQTPEAIQNRIEAAHAEPGVAPKVDLEPLPQLTPLNNNPPQPSPIAPTEMAGPVAPVETVAPATTVAVEPSYEMMTPEQLNAIEPGTGTNAPTTETAPVQELLPVEHEPISAKEAQAMKDEAYKLLNGIGVEKDIDAARNLYEAAAAAGNKQAQIDLAYLQHHGKAGYVVDTQGSLAKMQELAKDNGVAKNFVDQWLGKVSSKLTPVQQYWADKSAAYAAAHPAQAHSAPESAFNAQPLNDNELANIPPSSKGVAAPLESVEVQQLPEPKADRGSNVVSMEDYRRGNNSLTKEAANCMLVRTNEGIVPDCGNSVKPVMQAGDHVHLHSPAGSQDYVVSHGPVDTKSLINKYAVPDFLKRFGIAR